MGGGVWFVWRGEFEFMEIVIFEVCVGSRKVVCKGVGVFVFGI